MHLGRWIEPPAGRRLGHAPGARQLCDGWFELHLDQSVEDQLLLADAGELGTGTLNGLRIPLEDPPEDLVVVVRGEVELFPGETTRVSLGF